MTDHNVIEKDLLVIGAGPAGLSAAKSAAEAGLEVALIEKNNLVGIPVKTSGASWIQELKKFGIPEKYYNPIKSLTILTRSGEKKFETREPRSCILNITGLYQHICIEAIKAGTIIYLNTKATAILENTDNSVKIEAKKGTHSITIKARALVDASGFASFTVKTLDKNFRGFKTYGHGAEYDYYGPNIKNDEAYLIMKEDIAPYGYGWVFPWGNNRARVGVGLIKPKTKGNPKSYLEKLIKEERFIETFKGGSPIEIHTGFVPNQGVLERRIYGNVVVVGDAAGQVSPMAGEGIRYAIEIGSYAGEIIGEELKKGKINQRTLYKIKKYWDDKYGKTFRILYGINKKISGFQDEDWDRVINLVSDLKSEHFFELLRGNLSIPIFLGIVAYSPGILKSLTFNKIKNMLLPNI